MKETKITLCEEFLVCTDRENWNFHVPIYVDIKKNFYSQDGSVIKGCENLDLTRKILKMVVKRSSHISFFKWDLENSFKNPGGPH